MEFLVDHAKAKCFAGILKKWVLFIAGAIGAIATFTSPTVSNDSQAPRMVSNAAF